MMYLKEDSIDTITDMASRLSVPDDVLRAYIGVDDDDKEQCFISAFQSPSRDLPIGTSSATDSAFSFRFVFAFFA